MNPSEEMKNSQKPTQQDHYYELCKEKERLNHNLITYIQLTFVGIGGSITLLNLENANFLILAYGMWGIASLILFLGVLYISTVENIIKIANYNNAKWNSPIVVGENRTHRYVATAFYFISFFFIGGALLLITQDDSVVKDLDYQEKISIVILFVLTFILVLCFYYKALNMPPKYKTQNEHNK